MIRPKRKRMYPKYSTNSEWNSHFSALVRLVIGLVARASFQLELLSARTILRLGTGKIVWSGYIVQDGDLRDNWPL